MKLKTDDLSVLEKYGFKKIILSKNLPSMNYDWSTGSSEDYDGLLGSETKFEAIEEDSLLEFYEYAFTIGHSRRGQWYYYLVDKDGNIELYASEPDGSGGAVPMDNVIIKLYNDNLL